MLSISSAGSKGPLTRPCLSDWKGPLVTSDRPGPGGRAAERGARGEEGFLEDIRGDPLSVSGFAVGIAIRRTLGFQTARRGDEKPEGIASPLGVFCESGALPSPGLALSPLSFFHLTIR